MIGRSLSAALGLGMVAACALAAEAPPKGFCVVDPPIVVRDQLRTNAVAGSPFSFAVTWAANVPASWRTTIQEAINEWQNMLTDNGCEANPLPIYVRLQSLSGPLARTTPLAFGNGCISSDTLSFDSGAFTWFVDPTPWDDSEFTDPVAPPPDGYDLLTVARHELGHAVGWSLSSKNQGLVSNNVFDPIRLEIPTTTAQGGQGWHCDATWRPDDVMVPTTGQSERRAIALYPDVVVPARGFDGGCPIGVVDPNFTGTENGMPSFPWKTIANAQAFTPGAWPIYLAHTTHHVSINFVLNQIRKVESVHNGATIVAP